MKFVTLIAGLAITAGSYQAKAFEFPTLEIGGTQMMVVPLPPRRGHGGSAYAIVTRAAERHGVPTRLAHAIIAHESGHNCRARNRSGAAGLGQLMPGTARAMGVRNSMSCEQNADGAMKYLSRMLRMSGGDWCLAATGYNRGSIGGCSAYGRQVVRNAS